MSESDEGSETDEESEAPSEHSQSSGVENKVRRRKKYMICLLLFIQHFILLMFRSLRRGRRGKAAPLHPRQILIQTEKKRRRKSGEESREIQARKMR